MEIEDSDYRQFIVDCQEEDVFSAFVSVNETAYSGKKLTTNSLVPGRLSNPKFFSFWKDELLADEFVLDTIKNGYKFPFSSAPPSSFCPNNKSMLVNSEFAYAELLRLESLGCISRVEEQPFICLPLSVVFIKKLRLVVDASRHLNPYLQDRKIKLEGLEVRESLLQKGDLSN